jgi:hypothetical protein
MLYRIECWMVKSRQQNKFSVTRWEKIGVVPNSSEDGRILSQVDWASYEDLLNHTLMRRIDQMEDILI